MIIIGIKTTDTEKIDKVMRNVFGEQKEYRIVSNLTYFNIGWTAVLVDDSESQMEALEIQNLSRELDIEVVAYEELETVSYYKVVRYVKGQYEDELEIVDFEVVENSGFFENLEGYIENESEIDSQLSAFFREVGFEPRTEEILKQAE